MRKNRSHACTDSTRNFDSIRCTRSIRLEAYLKVSAFEGPAAAGEARWGCKECQWLGSSRGMPWRGDLERVWTAWSVDGGREMDKRRERGRRDDAEMLS